MALSPTSPNARPSANRSRRRSQAQPCGSTRPRRVFSSRARVSDGEQTSSDVPLKIALDYCLDLENGNRADGAKVQVWQCDPNNQNQQWLMFPWILQP